MTELFSGKLRQRFFIRVHSFLIFAAVIGSGVVGGRMLLRAGLVDMRVRYPLVVVMSYAVFFAMTRLWLIYLASHYRAGEITVTDTEESAGLRGSWDWLEIVEPIALGGEGIFAAILFAILFALLIGIAIYFVAEGPIILMEAAFQMFLSAGLIRSARRADRFGWSGVLFRRSIWAAIAVTILAVICGTILHDACPMATRMHEVFDCPR